MRRPSCRSTSARRARNVRAPLTATAVALAVGVLLAPASPARAATLQLAGPAGATVTINGTLVGFLPLAAPLTLEPGSYELLCELPGRIPHRQMVVFETDDQWLHLTVRVLPYSRRTAVFSNLALAGLGPRYLGHGTRGWVYTAAETGGLLAALVGELARSSAHKEYLLAMDAYGQAINADQIATLRAAADAKYQDARDAADLRDLGLLTAAGAVVVSMIDSWLSFAAVTAGPGAMPATAAVTGDDTAAPMTAADASSPSFHSALRLSF